jgi:ring-1,2-phenylacetyl-CoA epoxidase subunit PaaC
MTAPTLTSFTAPRGGAQGPLGGRAGLATRETYVLRLADTCLIWSHRLSEWCGHAPVLEEDIALANHALDLLGQARALLSLVGDEDQLAYLREEREFLNVTLAELPNGTAATGGRGDFAFTVLRNFVLSSWALLMWQHLASSSDAALAAVAGKAAKEARYHREHAADWVIRLGDGTEESARRMQAAVERLWPYTQELFDADAVDRAAAESGLGPAWSALREAWLADVEAVLAEATLPLPPKSAFRSDGKRGRHTEHMGHLLAEMQVLQRAYPGGVW